MPVMTDSHASNPRPKKRGKRGKTPRGVISSFCWPRVSADIKKVCTSCNVSRRTKWAVPKRGLPLATDRTSCFTGWQLIWLHTPPQLLEEVTSMPYHSQIRTLSFPEPSLWVQFKQVEEATLNLSVEWVFCLFVLFCFRASLAEEIKSNQATQFTWEWRKRWWQLRLSRLWAVRSTHSATGR